MTDIVWAEESKNGLRLKSDLDLMTPQRRPHVKLVGNPAVAYSRQQPTISSKVPMTRGYHIQSYLRGAIVGVI